MNLWKMITTEMSLIEIVAALATLLNVYLTIKNNIWCWLWGIVSVVLYGWVFYTGKLYSSMSLQIVYYLPMQFLGWWVWLRCGPQKNDDLPITLQRVPARVGWGAANIPIALGLGFFMSRFGASVSYWDALVTAMSVVGQYLLTRKYLENWTYWIGVNILYAFYILPTQKLYVSTALYLILLVLAFRGRAEWIKIMRQQKSALLTPEESLA